MCDRSAPLSLSSLRANDFTRRGFLRTAGAGALTVAISGGLHSHADAAEAHIKSVHGSGFCNLNYFLTEAKQLAKHDGVILDFVITPTSMNPPALTSSDGVCGNSCNTSSAWLRRFSSRASIS